MNAHDVSGHWASHVQPIDVHASEHVGEFTWGCACGPTMMMMRLNIPMWVPQNQGS